MMEDMIENYTGRGWVVHPLSSPKDNGYSPGKRPLLKNWQKLHKTPDNILQYVKKGCNIGLVCGKASSVTAVDLDSMLFADELFNGFEINTPKSQRTEGRGHLYFAYNSNLPSQKHRDLGIEILNDGSNIVLPPSVHSSGDVYRWVNPEAPLIKMPEELEKRLLRLFKTEAELRQMLSKSRYCFRDVLRRKPDVRGAEGREYMLAICTDLKAKGAAEEHVKMFARLVYRERYDEERTLKEWKYIDASKTWRCSTIRARLPAYIDCERCPASKAQAAIRTPEHVTGFLKSICSKNTAIIIILNSETSSGSNP